MEQVKIFSLNSRGIVGKIGKILDIIKKNDVTLLQEVKLGNTDVQINKRKLFIEKHGNCQLFISQLENSHLGVIITVSNKILDNIKKYDEIIKGRAQRLEIKNGNQSFNLINIYGPAKTSDRNLF